MKQLLQINLNTKIFYLKVQVLLNLSSETNN